MKRIRSRKGVTVIEVVIALAIITTISAASLSVITTSYGVEAKAEVAITVKNAAENAIECFRFADGSKTTFWECLGKTAESYEFGGISVKEDGKFEETGISDDASKARLISNGCTIMITCVNGKTFEFSAINAKGEEIYSFTYPEGGASE